MLMRLINCRFIIIIIFIIRRLQITAIAFISTTRKVATCVTYGKWCHSALPLAWARLASC